MKGYPFNAFRIPQDPGYPPGVTGDMLDRYYHEGKYAPPEQCWNCIHFYGGDRCCKDWNDMDESDYIPERDDRDPEDGCEDWEWDTDADYDYYFYDREG